MIKNYLLDLGVILKQQALLARSRARSAKAFGDAGFELGVVTGYYEVISLMKSQARLFGLSLREKSLEDIDPEADLLLSD